MESNTEIKAPTPTSNGTSQPQQNSRKQQEEKVTIYHHFDREVHSRLSFDNLTDLEDAFIRATPEEERCTSPDVVDYTKIKYPMGVPDYDALPTYPPRPHFNKKHIGMQIATQLVVFDGCPNDPYHPASMPIYQTSTFVQPSASEFGPYDYTRSGNPTRTALETIVAGLEDAHSAFAFSSGMAALSTVTRLVQAGEEIIAGDDLYGGMYRLLTKVSTRCGIDVKFVDTTNLEAVKAAITPKTRLVHIESPSNPIMRISDIRALSTLLHEHKILLSVDTTMMSPICQRPLDLGADIVVHSGTKFLSGHSDVIMGMVCVRSEELAKEVAFYQNAEGTGLAPFDCWLTLRGLKTLTLRVDKAQSNAEKVAQYLIQHPLVTDVHYAGLAPSEPKPWHKRDRDAATLQHEYKLHAQQATGGGSVLSFTTGNAELSKSFVDSLRLFKVTVSFGSCNSLVELPCLLSHASIPKDRRTLPEDLVRMSIGIEDIRDIIGDIERAFKKAAIKENLQDVL